MAKILVISKESGDAKGELICAIPVISDEALEQFMAKEFEGAKLDKRFISRKGHRRFTKGFTTYEVVPVDLYILSGGSAVAISHSQ